MSTNITELEAEHTKMCRELAEIAGQIDKDKATLDALQRELKDKESMRDHLDEVVEDLKGKIDELQDTIQAEQSAWNDLDDMREETE